MQILFTTGLMTPHTLNYLTLASECIALGFALSLPPVKHSLYFHRKDEDARDDVQCTDVVKSDEFYSDVTPPPCLPENKKKSCCSDINCKQVSA